MWQVEWGSDIQTSRANHALSCALHLHFWMGLKWIGFGRMLFPYIFARSYLVHWWCLSPVLVFGLDATWAASAARRQERHAKPWTTSRPNTETNADPFVDLIERGLNIMPIWITMSSKMYGVFKLKNVLRNTWILDRQPQVKRVFRLWLRRVGLIEVSKHCLRVWCGSHKSWRKTNPKLLGVSRLAFMSLFMAVAMTLDGSRAWTTYDTNGLV